jgi:subtilase family serine protease
VHTVAPAATLRVVLLPSDVLASAANATADMIAALRLAVSGTDVASIGWSLGEHFFTAAQVAQMHSILLGAAAHHVTVAASSGDNGSVSDFYGGTPVMEVSLPASDPLALAVGGTTLTANPLTGTSTSARPPGTAGPAASV